MDKQKLKYGAVVACYNREIFIGPYLEQMEKYNIKSVVTLGERQWYSQADDEVEEKDKTEKVINKYFPKIKLLKGEYSHQRDSLIAGIRTLPHCDVIFVNDCDIFLTKEDWEKCFNFIEDNYEHYDVFAINFETMILEYYYDYNYGKAAIRGGIPPIMAVKSGTEIRSMTKATSHRMVIWDVDGPKLHHFRWCKPSGSGKARCHIPTDNLDDYKKAPGEVIDLLKKWKKKLQKV